MVYVIGCLWAWPWRFNSTSSLWLPWRRAASLHELSVICDCRIYTVRYQQAIGDGEGPSGGRRMKMINSSSLNLHIEDLLPDTEYMFSVRIVKGRRQSPWSLNVFNRTKEMGEHFYSTATNTCHEFPNRDLCC